MGLQDAAVQGLVDWPRRRGLPWMKPNITQGDDGIVLEWWKGDRKLTVYLADDPPEYVTCWTESGRERMREGVIRSSEDVMRLWRWLEG